MLSNPKQRILIIDDEPFNLSVLSKMLGSEYDVRLAKNGETGLKMVAENNISLVLLDVVMEGMSGFDVLRRLKEDPETVDIPVILLTSLDSSDMEVKGLSEGAVDYVIKPFVDTVVKQRVKTHINLYLQMKRIEKTGLRDALTGIDNRRSFNQQIDIEWDKAIDNGSALGLLMIDVDRFKNFNDLYGHSNGDIALRTVAGVLNKSASQIDAMAYRWGGEEFAVILPGTGLNRALMIAEEMRLSIAGKDIVCDDKKVVRVSVSLGAGSITPKVCDSVCEFVSQVDSALYCAKKNGRNRVEATFMSKQVGHV